MRQPWKPMRRDEGEPMGQTGTDGTIYIYIYNNPGGDFLVV